MTKTLSIAVAAAVTLAAGVGCAFNPSNLQPTTTTTGPGSGHTISGLTSLSISPTSATLSVSSGGPTKTQQYKVTGIVNGHAQDVTSQVGYSVNTSGIVNVNNSGLATTTNTSGGVVVITAAAGSVTATAVLTVDYGFTGPDPGMAGQGVPANSGTLFTTTQNDASRAPQLIYPNDDVLFPPNVTGIEIHFMPGSSSNTLYEVSFKGPVSTINTFIRCLSPQGINGCIYLPDATLWRGVAISNAGQGDGAADRSRDRRQRQLGRRQQHLPHVVLEVVDRGGALLLDHQRQDRDHALGLRRQHHHRGVVPDADQHRRLDLRRLPRAVAQRRPSWWRAPAARATGGCCCGTSSTTWPCSRSRWRRRASSSPGTPTGASSSASTATPRRRAPRT